MFTQQCKKIDFNYRLYLAIENYMVTYKNNAHSLDFVLLLLLLIVPAFRCFSAAPEGAADCVGLLHFSASVVVNYVPFAWQMLRSSSSSLLAYIAVQNAQ